MKHESKHNNELDIGRRQPMMSPLMRLKCKRAPMQNTIVFLVFKVTVCCT